MKSANLCLRVRADCQALADRVVAEVWAAGALGVEEQSEIGGIELIIYLARPSEPAIRSALGLVLDEGLVIETSEPVDERDWSEAWKDGLQAIVISPRLVVRPSFVEHVLEDGQRELIVDPGRAFGTGGHESTRLALEWVAELVGESTRPIRVLDVGTGSGVLALSALRLGARRALGFDLDREAIGEARRTASNNGLKDRLALFAGPIEALRGAEFDLVLVNLLRAEMLPIAGEIAPLLSPEANLVLSGLLADDRPPVLEAFAAFGLEERSERTLRDASDALWSAPLLGFSR
jgi:ribosomal protein L11 methyltransferase